MKFLDAPSVRFTREGNGRLLSVHRADTLGSDTLAFEDLQDGSRVFRTGCDDGSSLSFIKEDDIVTVLGL